MPTNPPGYASLPSQSVRHFRTLALLALSLSAPLGGCGDAPFDARGQALADTAGRAMAGLETTSSTGWVLSGVDLSGSADRNAIQLAVRVIDDVLGGCVRATEHPAPALGITVGFVPGGCGIPLTPIEFRGSMSLDFAERGVKGGGSSLSLRFDHLTLLDTVLDGTLVLSAAGDAISYEATALHVEAGGQDVTLDGRGTMTTTGFHSAVSFDGNGMITTGEAGIAFTASGVHRRIRDCYPNEGTLVLRVTELGVPAEMTLRFDDDTADSGKVKVEWAGEEHEWYLPARGCTDR